MLPDFAKVISTQIYKNKPKKSDDWTHEHFKSTIYASISYNTIIILLIFTSDPTEKTA